MSKLEKIVVFLLGREMDVFLVWVFFLMVIDFWGEVGFFVRNGNWNIFIEMIFIF